MDDNKVKTTRFLWIIGLSILIIVCLFFFVFVSNKTIEKVVEANVYVEGEIIETSVITISGNIKKSHLSSEHSFVGTFAMEYYEPSCRDGVEAKIKWIDNDYQHITFFYAGNSSRLDVDKIEINEQMDSIMVSFADGTIIATSDAEIN